MIAAARPRDAGEVTFGGVDVHVYGAGSPEYPWLSRAPILRARPGHRRELQRLPADDVRGTERHRRERQPLSLQYTVIFTNEDGGTPTDRLMATWGRTTDIEFIYGLTTAIAGARGDPGRRAQVGCLQGAARGHASGAVGGDENNMVADHGPDDLIRFAPAPQMVSLDARVAREGDGRQPVDVRGHVGRDGARAPRRSAGEAGLGHDRRSAALRDASKRAAR